MLRPTFYSFETAKRALSNSQLGLDTMGHNIANANTLGYTRQRVDQVSFGLSGYTNRYVLRNGQLPGQGSLVTGISQIRDPYLDRRFRAESSDFGEYAAKNSGLSDLNDIFDEIKTGDGLYSQLMALYDELTKFGENPTSTEQANVVMTQAQTLVSILRKYNSDLDNVRTQQHSDLKSNIEDIVNPLLEQLATINERIYQEHVYGNPANELMDQRNMILDSLSEFVDLDYEYYPSTQVPGVEMLKVSVRANGTSYTLVDNDQCGKFTYTRNDPGGTAIIGLEEVDGTVHADFNSQLEFINGAFKGYLEIINGEGIYGNTDTRGIVYCQKILDEFAVKLADGMNQINVNAVDEQGNSLNGVNLFDYDPADPAKTLRISDAWSNDPKAILTSEDPVNGNKTTYIEQFKKLIDGDKINFTGTSNSGETFMEFLVSFQAQLGRDMQKNDSLLKASDKVLTGLGDQRNAVSAVNVDEEAVNMMIYQNYYNAAARFMTVLDEALGTIIQSMGVVGR